MSREEILQNPETAKLVEEYCEKSNKDPLCTWEQFVEHKLNEGKFKTEDDVRVGRDDMVYGTSKDFKNLFSGQFRDFLPETIANNVWFSIFTARQSWIEQNKPVLSYNDVMARISDILSPSQFTGFKVLLSDLVKSKMK